MPFGSQAEMVGHLKSSQHEGQDAAAYAGTNYAGDGVAVVLAAVEREVTADVVLKVPKPDLSLVDLDIRV